MSNNLAILAITVFLLIPTIPIIIYLIRKKQAKQKQKEEKENNAGSWKIKEIGNDEPKKPHETTRVVCNDDLKEAEQKSTKQICNNLLKIAREAKRKEKAEYEEAKKKLKKILESDSLLVEFIKTLWKRKTFFGRPNVYLSGGKMYFGIHSLEFQKDKKRLVLSINSYCGDYSKIERVIISGIFNSKSFFKDMEELTQEEVKKIEKLLEEISTDWIVKNCLK